MNLSQAIVQLWQAGYPVFYPRDAKIITVNETDLTCTVLIENSKNNKVDNVRWISPGIPKLNTKCMVIYLNNFSGKPLAVSIREFKKMKFNVGELNAFEISDTLSKLKFQNFTIEIKNNVLEISNLSGQSLKLDAVSDKWIFKGNLEIDGEVLIKNKLDVEQDITWNKASAATKASTHLHGTGVGPSDSPKAGS